jgi:hypothetical protein
MTENINSEALDKLFEIDGELWGSPSLVRMARIRASILHASSAWGSSDDGVLIGWLADEVERLTPYVEALRREERRAYDLATEVDRLRAVVETAERVTLWAERRIAPSYKEVLANDARNFRAALGETE